MAPRVEEEEEAAVEAGGEGGRDRQVRRQNVHIYFPFSIKLS